MYLYIEYDALFLICGALTTQPQVYIVQQQFLQIAETIQSL
jgi:hypothetical protein